MSTTHVKTPTSRLQLGHARRDITPPVGIYHRMWGAARHDAATGVHRPLQVDIVVLEPLGGDATQRLVRIQIDFVLLSNDQHDRLISPVAEATGVDPARVIITHSHSHAAGLYEPNRRELPGGELIDPYLEDLYAHSAATAAAAVANLADATITYASGRCDMAANRDYWDDANAIYCTGYNPDRPVANTVVVGRVSDPVGATRLILVNYACHPTTLAWDNTLISPDYPGAMRETIEASTGAPCLFLQGASGELGPIEGYVGDTSVADRNGRQLGYAALSAIESLPAPNTRFEYIGPVESGTALGEWKHNEITDESSAANAYWGLTRQFIPLPIRPGTPKIKEVEVELVEWEQKDTPNASAMVERKRRLLHRLKELPSEENFPLETIVFRLGGAVWIIIQGEPYSILQKALRERFPGTPLVISAYASHWGASYLPPKKIYDKGIYQESIAIVAAGSLEIVIETIISQIEELLK